MKTLKILVLLVLTSVTFNACSDSNPIENESTTQKSIALRTVLNEFKTSNNLSGKTDPANGFCFEFVYPLTFSFNNGTLVTVISLEGLIDVLSNETTNLYIEGIEFPFQVTGSNGAITTITNEEEFIALIESCGFDTFNDDLSNTFCFDIVFPIQVQLNGQVTDVNSLEDLLNLVNGPNSNGEIEIVFPISVNYNNETVVVNNIYEFYDMTNNCNQGGCVCTEEYAPVCVQTPNGIVEFGNMCFAECAGYSQNDLVPCNPNSCFISNLAVTVGNCNPDFSYQLTINFSYVNTSSSTFIVRKSSGEIVGSYALSDLPITINNYVSNTNATDFLTVELGANNSCSAIQNWILPNCSGCNCTTDVNPVCVYDPNGTLIQFDNSCLAACAGYTPNSFVNCNQSGSNFANLLGSCFTMVYPVVVQSGGALVTVNSNEQLLQYTSPAGGMPVMNYPISVFFSNIAASFTFANQAAFEEQINTHCN